MRILHVTDTHLGARMHVRGAPAGWTRGQDHLAALRAALAPALAEQVDLVLHTGDLFDRSRPPPAAVAAAAALWRDVARRVPVVLMPGNHDRRGLSRTTPVGHPGVHVVDQAERLVVKGVALAVVPFLADADGWAAAARRAVGPGADLLLCHQLVHGCSVPGYTFLAQRHRDCLAPRHVPDGVSHLLCGHLHPRQVHRLGHATVVMPGSTERTASSEGPQQKGCALWTLDGDISWEFVDLPTRPWRRVQHAADLAAVQPGALITVDRRVHDTDVDEAILARGGWVVGAGPGGGAAPRRPRPPDPQQSLF